MVVLATVLVIGGHLYPSYIADPGTIPVGQRAVVAAIAGVIVFMAVSTLSQLTTALMVANSLPATKDFLTTLGNFSLIGVIFGTALGFRVGSHLFVEAGRDPTRYGFPELMGTISDSVTLMTLIMVALCWPFSAGPLIEWGKQATKEPEAEAKRFGRLRGRLPRLGAFALLAAGNLIGYLAMIFMYQMLTG